jgi:hypothetical protein
VRDRKRLETDLQKYQHRTQQSERKEYQEYILAVQYMRRTHWALSAKTLDLAIRVNLVILEDSHLDLLALVLDLLGSLLSEVEVISDPVSREIVRYG